jgi:hypothetical protein
MEEPGIGELKTGESPAKEESKLVEEEKNSSSGSRDKIKIIAEKTRAKLRVACQRKNPSMTIKIFDAFVAEMLEKQAKAQERWQEQMKKVQEGCRALKERNAALKRTVDGMKAFNKMSASQKSIMLTKPEILTLDEGGTSGTLYKATSVKYKQKKSGYTSTTANSTAAPAGFLAPSPATGFQASLSSGLSTLYNSLVASKPNGAATLASEIEHLGTFSAIIGDTNTLGNSSSSSSSSHTGGVGGVSAAGDSKKRKNTSTTPAADMTTATYATTTATDTAFISPENGQGGEATGVGKKRTRTGRMKCVEVPFPLVKRALERYKEIYGHMVVMGTFIIPPDETWPEEMWGIKLGSIALRIRNGIQCKDSDRRAQLVRVKRTPSLLLFLLHHIASKLYMVSFSLYCAVYFRIYIT